MMTPTTAIPPSEVALTQLVSGPPPATIEQVIARMRAIDAILPSNDGVKWFNRLYLMVTQDILSRTPPGGWKQPLWLSHLDVVFANLYFGALLDWGRNRAATPGAWEALFEARYRPNLARVQFALAGMNAHINHDLPFALVRTGNEMGIPPRDDSPQHVDYQAVNDILAAVEPQAMQVLATGIIGELAEDLGRFGQLFAMWSIRRARDTAWHNAQILWELRSMPMLFDRYQDVIGGMTGFAGRGLLTPIA